MTNQENQNDIKANTTAPKTYRKSKLAFVGCENCSGFCCNGTKFSYATVLLYELHDVAKFFPVVFKRTDDGEKIEMRLIFNLKKGVPCLYFDPASKKCTIWDRVRPHVCKSYPFMRNIKSTEGSKTHFNISMENKFCDGIKESSEGIKIFTDDNEITEEVLDIFFGRDNLANYEKHLKETNKFLDLVNEMELLVGAEIILGKKKLPESGFKEEVLPILIISEQKLAALGADSLKRLQTAGYINAINIHRKSLFNFQKLIQAMTAFEKSKLSKEL